MTAVGTHGPVRLRRILVAGVACVVAALLGALVAPARSMAAVTPTLLVANSGANTLTSYPLAASGDASPGAIVASDGSGSLESPGEVALDAAGDLWVANFSTDSVVEYTKSQLAAGGDPAPAVTLTSDGSSSLDAPNGVVFDARSSLMARAASTLLPRPCLTLPAICG